MAVGLSDDRSWLGERGVSILPQPGWSEPELDSSRVSGSWSPGLPEIASCLYRFDGTGSVAASTDWN